MNIKSTFLALLLLLALCSGAKADDVIIDDLWRAIDRTGTDLTLGKDRGEILGRLNQAIGENPESPYLKQANWLSADLADSIVKEAAPAEGNGESIALMETKMHVSLLAYTANWGSPLERFFEEKSDDPIVPILKTGRKAIGRLIPLLRDMAPTRSYIGLMGDIPRIPRVCYVALVAIEYFSQCRFNFNASSARLYHEPAPEVREENIAGIEKWWEENKEKTVAEGIRAQLPNGNFHSKVWMAKNLANLGEEEGYPDREYALEVLRYLVLKNHGHTAVHAAKALAEYGDYSSVDVFYADWKASLDSRGKIYDGSVVRYLTDYGARREWELLCELAKRQIEHGRLPGTTDVLPPLVGCGKASSSLYAIPGLALALPLKEDWGARESEISNPRPHYSAYEAAGKLQKLTGIDFGYVRKDPPEIRAAAVRKAFEWWAAEGSNKYTFDYIEAEMKKRPDPRANFFLTVSSQCFAIDPVDIRIEIDGKVVVEEDFYVENQHNWKQFKLYLPFGKHELKVKSYKGGAELTKEFETKERRHVLINYWYYPDQEEDYPRHFSFEISDKGFVFR